MAEFTEDAGRGTYPTAGVNRRASEETDREPFNGQSEESFHQRMTAPSCQSGHLQS